MNQKMTEEQYIIVYTMILSEKLTEKMSKKNESKMTEEQYIVLYNMIYSQKVS